MKYKNFEDYLQEKHMEANPMILDDDLPDHFDEWLGNLDIETVIIMADAYGAQKHLEGVQEVKKLIDDQ